MSNKDGKVIKLTHNNYQKQVQDSKGILRKTH